MILPMQCSFPTGRLMLVAIVACAGCGTAEKPQLEVFPVSGKIAVDGKPPVRAEVRFHPATPLKDPGKRSVEPYAYVQADGTFRIGTYLSDDGAPPGEYKVLLVWPTITVEGGEEVAGPDRLHGRFSNPAMPIALVTVKETENRVPDIELKSR